MQKVIFEEYFDGNDTVFKRIELNSSIPEYMAVYYYNRDRDNLETTLNNLGLQDMYEILQHARLFLYHSTNQPLEALQQTVQQSGKPVCVGLLETYLFESQQLTGLLNEFK